MQEAEGVIKFTLDHQTSDAAGIAALPGFDALNHCRHVMREWGVIGQDDARYEGLGYGNISMRLENAGIFVISGTQTGHLPQLSASDYASILDFDLRRNCLQSTGPVRPSSEAMTHAAIYQRLSQATVIVHGHSPLIWRQARYLDLAATAADIAYGTPAMAWAMQNVLQAGGLPFNTIVMQGHADGFITWGRNPEELINRVQALMTAAEHVA